MCVGGVRMDYVIRQPSDSPLFLASLSVSVRSGLIRLSQRPVALDFVSSFESRMSSSYPRCAPLGSSLPNDYAILSYMASSQGESALESDNDSVINDRNDSESPSASPRPMQSRGASFRDLPVAEHGATAKLLAPRRRLSMPYRTNGIIRKMSSGGQVGKSTARPTEREPLLAAEVGSSGNGRNGHAFETWKMWVQEFKIICKYTAPVFGSVDPCHILPKMDRFAYLEIINSLVELICWSIHCLWLPS